MMEPDYISMQDHLDMWEGEMGWTSTLIDIEILPRWDEERWPGLSEIMSAWERITGIPPWSDEERWPDWTGIPDAPDDDPLAAA